MNKMKINYFKTLKWVLHNILLGLDSYENIIYIINLSFYKR